MSSYDKLVGLPYVDGKQDCYSCVRRYYELEWGVELPNLARPDRFWEDPHLDLYGLYEGFGFQQIFDRPYKIGDALLMPLLALQSSHAVVIVDDNQILHHLPNQLSTLEPLRPRWASRGTIHLRHPAVTKTQEATHKSVHLHEVLDADVFRNPAVQEAIDRELASRR